MRRVTYDVTSYASMPIFALSMQVQSMSACMRMRRVVINRQGDARTDAEDDGPLLLHDLAYLLACVLTYLLTYLPMPRMIAPCFFMTS